jgi:hypothetical protein
VSAATALLACICIVHLHDKQAVAFYAPEKYIYDYLSWQLLDISSNIDPS